MQGKRYVKFTLNFNHLVVSITIQNDTVEYQVLS